MLRGSISKFAKKLLLRASCRNMASYETIVGGKSVSKKEAPKKKFVANSNPVEDIFEAEVMRKDSNEKNMEETNVDDSISKVNTKITMSKDESEMRRGCENVRNMDKESIEKLDTRQLVFFLYSAYRFNDVKVALKVFPAIKNPNSRDYNQYISVLWKNANSSNDSTAAVHSELTSIWSKVVASGFESNSKIITCLVNALSFSNDEQRKLICKIIEKPANEKYDGGVLAAFLKHCKLNNDVELGRSVWNWGELILDRYMGSDYYFPLMLQSYQLFGTSVEELKDLWDEITARGMNGRYDLVTATCSALSIDLDEQNRFISKIISNLPSPTFNCSILCYFLKHCSETHNKELAKRVWEWGQNMLKREFGSSYYFSLNFLYLNIFGASLNELNALWNQIGECRLNDDPLLVNAMCSSLSIDGDQQIKFITQVISKPPCPSFKCGLLGTFLVPCGIQNNLPLAQRIWSWGSRIRERERGSESLCRITIQYLVICSENGNLNLLESVWKDAEDLKVARLLNVKKAYLNALVSHGATERVIKFIDNVGTDTLDGPILTIILKSFSDGGQCYKALELLRRFEKEIPSSISIISYTSVIYGLCERGDFDAALSLVEEAKSHGHHPNSVTWKTILSLCPKSKNLPVALRAFEEIKRIETNEQILADAYMIMTKVYKACGDEVKAAEIEQDRKNKGLEHGRYRVDLDLDGIQKISFFLKQIPSTLAPEVSEKIELKLKEWMPLLEERNISTEPIKQRYAEMLALAFAVAVLNMKEVVIRKEFRLSVESHEANRVLAGILGIKILHWDQFGHKDLPHQRHTMSEGKCSCRVRY